MFLSKSSIRLLTLAFGHGLNDFIAGYMLGTLMYMLPDLTQVATGFLLYNLLAFGGQFLAARLVQSFHNTKMLLVLAAVVNLMAVVLFRLSPMPALILAGCASAVYHVAGGAVCAKEGRATEIGLFAAPGIIGLAAGGYLAYLHVDLWHILLVVACVFIVFLQLLKIPLLTGRTTASQPSPETPTRILDRHDVIMIILLGIISLRSAVWNVVQIVHEQNYTWLLAIAASAFAGKVMGGWLSDRIGWRMYTIGSLVTAMPLLTFCREEITLFCVGIGLFQSAIPANTAMMIDHYRGQKAKGIAFSFGTAIVLGALLTLPLQYFGANIMLYGGLGILVVICGLLAKNLLYF